MTREEALQIAYNFEENTNPNEKEVFAYTEAMNFLIKEYNDPDAMMSLGGYYYGMRRFDLALKYYEMAAELNHPAADECLGYIWYYGRTGERNYEKAFYYFSKMMVMGNPVATYKVADMYRNGYYVERDYEKYVEIIEGLYPKVKKMDRLNEPVPEVFTRLARIRTEQGQIDKARKLYIHAKDFLAQRIEFNNFFGNLNIMKWLINDLYSIKQFDEKNFDLYDLYFLMKAPCKVSFLFDEERYEIEAVMEGAECAIHFGDKWFHSIDDFIAQAEVKGDLLTSLYFDLYEWTKEK